MYSSKQQLEHCHLNTELPCGRWLGMDFHGMMKSGEVGPKPLFTTHLHTMAYTHGCTIPRQWKHSLPCHVLLSTGSYEIWHTPACAHPAHCTSMHSKLHGQIAGAQRPRQSLVNHITERVRRVSDNDTRTPPLASRVSNGAELLWQESTHYAVVLAAGIRISILALVLIRMF